MIAPELLDEYIVVMGPTASGKSKLALDIAQRFDGEIINCDSIQVYKGFHIGAAQPDDKDLKTIPHHLYGFLPWHQDHDARRHAELMLAKLQQLRAQSKLPVIVGGTGLYLKALWGGGFHNLPMDKDLRTQLDMMSDDQLWQKLQDLDPERADTLHKHDRFRIIRAVELGILTGQPASQLYKQQAPEQRGGGICIYCCPKRQVLHQRIALRVEQMLAAGLIEEVEGLLAAGVLATAKPMQAIGYKEVVAHLQKEGDLEELKERIVVSTRQYAKRQCTWFRKVSYDFLCEEGQDGIGIIQQIEKTLA